MYVKVYIFGIEMSQRIHFWYQNLLKITIFWENGKKITFWLKKSWTAYKNNFELNMLKLL